jgi:hypothetical protein
MVTTVSVLTLLVVLVFWAYCLYDFTKADKSQLRTFSAQTWIVILVVTSLFGSLLWWFNGRPQTPRSRRDG